jgi:hypothetical protein
MPDSPLKLIIAPNAAFRFTWHGWPLTTFTLPEAYRVRNAYPKMTIIDQRLRIVDDDTSLDENEE